VGRVDVIKLLGNTRIGAFRMSRSRYELGSTQRLLSCQREGERKGFLPLLFILKKEDKEMTIILKTKNLSVEGSVKRSSVGELSLTRNGHGHVFLEPLERKVSY